MMVRCMRFLAAGTQFFAGRRSPREECRRKNRIALAPAFAQYPPMLARVLSAAVNGIEAFPVEVEVNSGWGDTVIVIVGLPDAAVKESRDRVSTALTNSGFKFPMGRTTINLAPADVRKEGPSFDLPIAIGMLAASDQLMSDQLDHFVMVGELALTGQVRPVKGVLSVAWRARAEKMTGVHRPGGKRGGGGGGGRFAGHPGGESARGRRLSRRRNQDHPNPD